MRKTSDVARAGAALVNIESDRWFARSDIKSATVVFIHGFTSHGEYLTALAEHVHRSGFTTALFNYDSYLGIDRGFTDLANRLSPLSVELEKHGLVLVGHSMGGLVARLFSTDAPRQLRNSLRGLILLGTPNGGVFGDERMVSLMVDWGEAVSGPNPFARSVLCRAAQQLTLNDTAQLIQAMNSLERAVECKCRVLTISGGRPFLEFGGQSDRLLGNALRNRLVQRLFKGRPNDGLVPETSSDLSIVLRGTTKSVHQNRYSDYPRTNHTYLTQNQEIAGILVDWLTVVFSRTPSVATSGGD